jgi:hypothetical protein
MRTGYVAIGLLVGMGIHAQMMGPADARNRRYASEARVEQAHGNLPAGAKAIDGGARSLKAVPEGGATTGVSGSSAPVTCNQQNASSPACYSATQQARPVTR